MIENLAEEWNRRTWYGRLWFPLWVVGAVLKFASVFFFVALVYLLVGAPVKDAYKALKSRLGPSLGAIVRRARRVTPEVYHE